MAKKPAKKNTDNSRKANNSLAEVYVDEFTIPSLVEANLQGLPLTDEENRQLELIEQDENLRQEYLGLLSVMRHLDKQSASPSGATLYYLVRDSQNRVHRVENNQNGRLNYLLEGGASLVGVEPIAPTKVITGSQELTPLGIILEFKPSGQIRLTRLEENLGMVAENKADYNYQSQPTPSTSAGGWYIQAELGQGQFREINFNEQGIAEVPRSVDGLLIWKLFYK